MEFIFKKKSASAQNKRFNVGFPADLTNLEEIFVYLVSQWKLQFKAR